MFTLAPGKALVGKTEQVAAIPSVGATVLHDGQPLVLAQLGPA
jgi:hypothetical protein